MRRVILPVLSRVNVGDVTIRHHYTGDAFRLHSYRHRSYWFRGRRREAATMAMFGRLVKAGDFVIEAGGHIGYLTLFFADLTGPGGSVVVFEPGFNNLPYLYRNTSLRTNVRVVPDAVGSSVGSSAFYVEDLTGQNNTLVEGYEIFDENVSDAGSSSKYRQVEVDVVTLDSWCSDRDSAVDWIKFDIEGAELAALQGASHVIEQNHPGLMVEVTMNQAAVSEFLRARGYVLFNDLGAVLHEGRPVGGNVFALHRDRHARQLRGILGAPLHAAEPIV